MLLFQRNADHILVDGCQRAGIDPVWLIEIIAEVNRYLPDDWRMTRSRNNFRIQIVAKHSATLVGSCYRAEGEEILHIIDSLHLKHFHDCVDLSRRPAKIKGRLNKRDHAEFYTPNLYYFRPVPEGFVSPLFARQYERIKLKADGSKVGDQYHRVHPLSRAGLDLEHFLWLRWTITGEVTVVETPASDYHGKDYWAVPRLSDDGKRAERAIYLRDYRAILDRYKISSSKAPDVPLTTYETEYKFLIHGGESEAAAVFDLIEEAMDSGDPKIGFTISDRTRRHKSQVDIYFDDDRLSLYQAGVSFRMRKKDAIRVTLKKRFPQQSETNIYRRIEEEAVITGDQEQRLMNGKPIHAFPFRLIPYIVPECGPIVPNVIVKNERRILHIQDDDYRKAEVCFDRVRYGIEGKQHGPVFEVEIESKGAAVERIQALARYLETHLDLERSLKTKYERGVSLLDRRNRT